jgi:AcrR family transcriptional regulator
MVEVVDSQPVTDQEDPRSGDAPSTREALIAAATELFAEQGYSGTSVEQIAQRAGANKAMVSYHFGGKEALYRTILETTFGAVAERLVEIRDGFTDPEQGLRDVVAAIAAATTRHPSLPALVIREVVSGGRHVDDELLPRFLAIFGAVAKIVDAGVRGGTFRPVDPRYTHLSVVGSLFFYFGTEPFRRRLVAQGLVPGDPPFETAEYVRHVQELMARGLKPAAEDR